MYEFVDEIHRLGNRIVEETRKLSLGEQTPERVYSFCLHGRILDLASAVLALLKSHDVAGIPHLVRGQLEAFADLVNLTKSANHLRNMEAAYCESLIRVLRAIPRERFSDTGVPDPETNLKAAEARLAELRAQGATTEVAQRFREAGLIREYYSVYAYLCGHSHNNLNALEERHIDKSVDPYQLLIALDTIDVELTILIELAVSLPVRSLGLLKPTDEASYELLCNAFTELRGRWSHLYRSAGAA